MASFELETVGRVGLTGPAGPIVLADPRALALLVRLAAAPDRTAATDDLLLAIWPHLTRPEGRAALDRVARLIAGAAGTPLTVVRGDRWTLSSDVTSDVDRASAREAARFLARFTLPDTPEWTEWVGRVRKEIALRPGPAPVPRRWRRPIVVLATVAAIVGAALRFGRPRPVAEFKPGDQVILADLDPGSGDSALARALQTAAMVGLQQAGRIDLVSRGRAMELAKAAGGNPAKGGLDPKLAVQAAARGGVPWVVTIVIGATKLTTRLIRARTGAAALTLSESADNAVGLVTALDGTIRALQRRIGESDERLREQPFLAYATTSNLDALRAYAEGTAAWRGSEYSMARDLWERAVTLDTGFAMAMGSLGAYHYYRHDRALGESYYQRALARTARLSLWERLRIEGGYATARGDLDSALAVDRQVAATFPRAGTYYTLGTGLLQMDRCPEALEALERARRFDPSDANAAINVATCHKRLTNFDRALRAYEDAGRLDSLILYRGNVNLEYAGTLVSAGRPAEAESVLTRMSRRIEMADQGLGFRGLGYLALWQGHIELAQARFLRAAAISRQQGAPSSLLRNLALAVAAGRAGGEQRPDRRLLGTIDSLSRLESVTPAFLAFAANAHQDDRDAAAVTTLLELMRRRADPRARADSAQIWYVTGTLAAVAGDARAAVIAFDRGKALPLGTMLAVRLALALEQSGQLDSARSALRSIAAAPSFGSEDQIAWMRAVSAVGQLEERTGRVEDAIASYRRFLDFWKDADPGLPDVVRVRGRLSALLSRPNPRASDSRG